MTPDAKRTGWLESNTHGDRDTFPGPFPKACHFFWITRAATLLETKLGQQAD